LLTPPGTPLFPLLEMEPQKVATSQSRVANAPSMDMKSKPSHPPVDPASRSTVTSSRSVSSTGVNSSIAGVRRPSSSGGPKSNASWPAKPAAQPTLPSMAKPSRASTPTSRATFPSSKPVAHPVRSSTPTRTTARSSTPTARQSKATSRTSTPTRRQSTSSRDTSTSDPAGRSSSVTKSGPVTLKKSSTSRGTSPTMKSRPWKPSETPGFPHETPSNLRTTLPVRPSSASRGRPSAPGARVSSIESSSNAKLRRQSCSPSRGRTPNYNKTSLLRATSRGYSDVSDDVNPVLMGTKMVERVVNMRRLAPPPKQDEPLSTDNNSGRSSSSQDKSGFGRTLSKKSFDMALRHMLFYDWMYGDLVFGGVSFCIIDAFPVEQDIRRSVQGTLRPLTNVPASSIYSVRSEAIESRSNTASDSPLATSSNASSELSFKNKSRCLDESEVEDSDLGSESGR
ncbi:hypothetical protein RJ639_005380, partial [Escallonia herrerae]